MFSRFLKNIHSKTFVLLPNQSNIMLSTEFSAYICLNSAVLNHYVTWTCHGSDWPPVLRWISSQQRCHGNSLCLRSSAAWAERQRLHLELDTWHKPTEPQSFESLTGISTLHSSPPILQFICKAILVATVISAWGLLMVRDTTHWLGVGQSTHRNFFTQSYLSFRLVGRITTTYGRHRSRLKQKLSLDNQIVHECDC